VERKIKFAIIASVICIPLLIVSGCVFSKRDVPYYQGSQTVLKPQNTIAVTGNGTVKVTPDMVSVSITVLTEEATSQDAVNKNSEISEQVISAIKGIDARELKIETTGYNLQPLYDYNREDQPPQIYAYRATSTIEASTIDIDKIGDIMAKAIDAGANDISSLRFDLSDQTKKQAKVDALAKATEDATQKAEAIADSLNLKIGKIYYINESGISYPGPVYAEEAALAAGEVPEGKGVAPPPISPRELEVSAQLEIVFNFN